MHEVRLFITFNFDMEDIVKANIMLDIKVIRDNDCIILSHTYYIEKTLKR